MNLFCSIDASALAAVMLVLVVVMMIAQSAPHHGFGPDLPHASHAVSMSGANREDAMVIAVMRDGKVFLGNEHIRSDQLSSKVLDRLKEVLDGVRSAGIERIAFLVVQRRPPMPER
jgi:biopolymer transport protein ExbD/biopolymer transport protein TolR